MLAKDLSPYQFGQLFTNYREKYISIARSYVRDEFIAEDIVADSFTAFWDNRNKIDIKTIPESYILQSVKNRCLNHLRDKSNKLRIEKKMQEDGYKAIMAEINILGSEDLGFLFETEVAKIFTNFLNSLPPLTKDIFYSSRFENFTYQEIAEKYGVSTRKVKREIQHVLALMRISLQDYLPFLLFIFFK